MAHTHVSLFAVVALSFLLFSCASGTSCNVGRSQCVQFSCPNSSPPSGNTRSARRDYSNLDDDDDEGSNSETDSSLNDLAGIVSKGGRGGGRSSGRSGRSSRRSGSSGGGGVTRKQWSCCADSQAISGCDNKCCSKSSLSGGGIVLIIFLVLLFIGIALCAYFKYCRGSNDDDNAQEVVADNITSISSSACSSTETLSNDKSAQSTPAQRPPAYDDSQLQLEPVGPDDTHVPPPASYASPPPIFPPSSQAPAMEAGSGLAVTTHLPADFSADQQASFAMPPDASSC